MAGSGNNDPGNHLRIILLEPDATMGIVARGNPASMRTNPAGHEPRRVA